MSTQTNRIIEKANRYAQKRQFDKALKEVERALQSDPEDLRLLHKKGDLLVRMELLAKAVQTYLKLAELYSHLGFHVKAIAVYKQALKTEAAPVEIQLLLSAQYHQLKMKREAIESLEIVLDEYERNHRLDEMRDVLQRLIAIDSESIEPIMRLCDLLLLQAERTQAIALLAETATQLAEEERVHEHREVMQRLIALDASHDRGEGLGRARLRTLLDEAPAPTEEVEIADADILPVSPAAAEARKEHAVPVPVASHFFMDLEAAPSCEIEPVAADNDTNVLDQGEEPGRTEHEATVVVSLEFLESRQGERLAPRAEPAPAAPVQGDEELEESLEEIDFFVQQKLFDDAWDLLIELQGKMPRHPRVLSRIRSVAALRRTATGRLEILSDGALSDSLLSVA